MLGEILVRDVELAVGVEGRKAECSFDFRERESFAGTLPQPNHQAPFTPAQWLAPICKADVNLTPKERTGGWHCVRYNARQEVQSLDESKVIFNGQRKTSNLLCVGDC